MVLSDVAALELDHTMSHWFATAANSLAGAVLAPLQGTDLFQFGITPTDNREGPCSLRISGRRPAPLPHPP